MTTGRQPSAPAGRYDDAGQYGNPPEPQHRLASHAVVGFIPWILFWVIGGPSTWETAAIAALIAAVLVAALSLDFQPVVARVVPGSVPGSGPGSGPGAAPGRHPGLKSGLAHLKLLDLATVAFFLALTIAAIVTSRHDAAELDKYTQALSSGALGLIALGSIVAGHPFTIDYAREQTPPQVWRTPAFRRVNVVLTWVWTAVFLISAGLGLWAQHAGVRGLRDWLNWYIPIVLIFVAFRFTRWYPAQVRQAQLREAAGHPGDG
jgi:hypothetical protein